VKNIKVSKYTQDQAKEYANNESEIHGFPVGSPKWSKCYKDYLTESYSTMALGRNPRPGSFKYKAFIVKYPEVFSSEGFAGVVSKAYRTAQGEKGLPLEEVQNRIMSTVMNLVKVYENGVMGTFNTTKGAKQGKISNAEMSELQMPNKEEFKSDEEFQAAKKDVVYNWFQRDVLIDVVIESLLPFFKLQKNEVEKILGAIELGDTSPEVAMGKGRLELVDKL
jgi:hypothetical protein